MPTGGFRGNQLDRPFLKKTQKESKNNKKKSNKQNSKINHKPVKDKRKLPSVSNVNIKTEQNFIELSVGDKKIR